MALLRDGEELRTAAVGQPALVDAKSVAQIWGDPAFGTLALGLALALFAQIGLLAHLVSLLVLTLGVQKGGGLLIGVGIGKATSLPPLIVQVEFSKAAARVVPVVLGISQATYDSINCE